MTTPPREHDTSDVGPVNEAAALEAAPAEPPEVDGTGDFDPSSAVEWLWHRVARVEAIARAARDSLESLPLSEGAIRKISEPSSGSTSS